MGSPRLATPQAPRGTLLVERRHLSPNLSEAPSRPSWLRLVSLPGMAGAAATALRHPCNGADRREYAPSWVTATSTARVAWAESARLASGSSVTSTTRQRAAGPAAPHLAVEYTGDKEQKRH